MTRLHSLREAIFGTPKAPVEVKELGSVIIGTIEQSSGIDVSTSLYDQVEVFNSDPVLKESILQFAQEIISTGFFTTIDETYKLILAGKTAKTVIDEWNRLNDLDNKALQISTELVAFGNSFWYIGEGGFTNIPIESVYRAYASQKNVPIRQEYDLQLTAAYKSKILKWGTFIHYKTNVTGMGVFGSGTILGILAKPDDDTPSLWEIRKSVRASMKEGFEKFSFGNVYIGLPGISDAKAEEMGKQIGDMSSRGNRIVSNSMVQVGLEVPQRTQTYDQWLKQIDKEFYAALIMGVTPDTQFTTKATAEALREAFMMRVASMRRVMKRQTEGLWTKVLDKLGYEGLKADPKMHFGSKDIEYITADVFKAVEDHIIEKEEARTILKEYMHWRLEGKAPLEPTPEPTPKEEA